MAQIFNQAFEQKLIYVYRINDTAHEGILKIGEASCNAGMTYFVFEPNQKLFHKNHRLELLISLYNKSDVLSRLSASLTGQDDFIIPFVRNVYFTHKRSVAHGFFAESAPYFFNCCVEPCLLLNFIVIVE